MTREEYIKKELLKKYLAWTVKQDWHGTKRKSGPRRHIGIKTFQQKFKSLKDSNDCLFVHLLSGYRKLSLTTALDIAEALDIDPKPLFTKQQRTHLKKWGLSQ